MRRPPRARVQPGVRAKLQNATRQQRCCQPLERDHGVSAVVHDAKAHDLMELWRDVTLVVAPRRHSVTRRGRRRGCGRVRFAACVATEILSKTVEIRMLRWSPPDDRLVSRLMLLRRCLP